MKYKGLIIASILFLLVSSFFFTGGKASAATTVTASNGTASAIQSAINTVNSAGGGTVNIPSGTFNLGGSVTVPGNVKLIGAGLDRTILRTSGTSQVINVRGNNIRVSGLTLISTNYDGSVGISILNSIDYRVDNVRVEGYSYAGISINGRDTRGVVDHSTIKMKQVTGLGYGVMVLRSDYWENDMRLGTAYANFIEDCTIINARHAVAANQGAHYVFRYSHVTQNVVGQAVDAHGIGNGSLAGTRAVEVYNNVIDQPVSGANGACGIRGGGGVIFNNTVSGYKYGVVLMVEDGQTGMSYPIPQQVKDMYIWGNQVSGGPEVIVATSPASTNYIKPGRDYFNSAMPGYTPYTYPHPLTQSGGSTPPPPPPPPPTTTTTSPPAPVNHAPVLAAIGNKTVAEGATLSFTTSASDPDGDSLTYYASGLPAGSNFNAGSRTFSWTPSSTQAGSYNVQFGVSDGSLSDSETINITVTEVNRAPVLADLVNRSVTTGSTLSFTVAASDPDGNRLTFSAFGLPAGATLNSGTGAFSWTPTSSQTGSFPVQFVVSDGSLTDSQTIVITVTGVTVPPVFSPIRVNAGGGAYTDSAGNRWLADQAFDGSWGFYGNNYTVNRGSVEIGGTADDYIFQTERWNFEGYRFAVPDGTYDVALHFAETFAPGVGRRVFDVSVQGQTALDNLDVYAEAGLNTALVKTLEGVTVNNGVLEIAVTENIPFDEINGIEILLAAAPPAPPTPDFVIHVNAGGGAYTDGSGNDWLADQAFDGSWGFYGGDFTVDRGDIEIGGTSDDYIYQTERWNVEGYWFAVPDGTYQVVLHFAETFAPGEGRRVFDVTMEGQTVLSNLDIFAEAGSNTALVKIIDNVTVSDGVLDIAVTENVPLDEINGIEIIQLS